MNIAFITPEYITEYNYDGGLSNYVNKAALALVDRGHNVFVIVSSFEDKQFVSHGVNVVRVYAKSKVINFFNKIFRGRFYTPISWLVQSWKLNKALKNLNKCYRIDVVQYASFTATAFFRSLDVPSISRLSSFQPILDNTYGLNKTLSVLVLHYLELQALKKSDAVFGPSKLLSGIVSKIIHKKIKVIESPLLLYKSTNDKVFKDVVQHKKYLLFFGTLGVLKGVKEIADILPILLDSNPDLYFLFIGKDIFYNGEPIMNYVWNMAGNNRGRCIYLGRLEQDKLNSFIINSLAIVLPSRVDNFPNTCTEAMAMGKIVIGTRGASFDQLIDDKKNGFLCEIGNKDSLLNAVNEVLALDDDKKKRIENNAKVTVSRLEPSIIAEKLEKFYLDVISAKQK